MFTNKEKMESFNAVDDGQYSRNKIFIKQK